MGKKLLFTCQEEQILIDFIRSHEILHNVRHPHFRQKRKKYNLWKKLAKELGKSVDVVKKRWMTMRDYFVRRKQARPTIQRRVTKRESALMFLLDYPNWKTKNIESENHSCTVNIPDVNMLTLPTEVCRNPLEIDGDDGLIHIVNMDSKVDPEQQSSDIDFTKISCESCSHSQASNFDYDASRSKQGLDIFFESIAATMISFPSVSIAKIKLQISQIVGQEEVALANRQFFLAEN